MSMRVGVLRIATAIRVIGVGIGWLWWIGGFIALVVNKKSDEAWFYLAICGVIGFLFWGAGKGAAWIIEGFAPDAPKAE